MLDLHHGERPSVCSLCDLRRAEYQQPFAGRGPCVGGVDQEGSYLCEREGVWIGVETKMRCHAAMESNGLLQRERVVGVGRELPLLPSGCVLATEPGPIAAHDDHVRAEGSDQHPKQGGELLYEV